MKKFIFVSHELSIESSLSNKILKRLDTYSRELNKTSDWEAKLTVILKTNRRALRSEVYQSYPSLEIVPIADSASYDFQFLIRLIRICTQQSKIPTLLIAGDPWRDAVIATVLKKMLWWLPISTQVSIHGNLIEQEGSCFKRIIKKVLLSFSLNNTDSIRVVSQHLSDQLIQDVGIDQSKIFVAPIPVSLPKREAIQQNLKQSIGFVGRLHHERGLGEFVEIVSKLKQSCLEYDYLIVGDGPDRASFLDNLSLIVGPRNIDYRGFLNEHEMPKVWKSCKILLSTAPSEGYGLALRESLLNGTFVVARKNAGTIAAQVDYGSGIHLYSDVDEAVNLVKFLMADIFPEYTIENFRIQILESNKKSLSNLVESWQQNYQLTDDTQDSS